MTALIATLRPVMTELAVLAALAAPAAYGLARRPASSERLLCVRPKLWIRILTWSVVGLVVWAAVGRIWLGIAHEGFALQSALAVGTVKLGIGAVLSLHFASATLVAGRDGVHWFSFYRPWSELPSVSRTETGLRFRIEGRPSVVEAAVLDDSLWAVDDPKSRTLRTLVRTLGTSASDPTGTSPPGRPGQGGLDGSPLGRGARRPLPPTSRRLER